MASFHAQFDELVIPLSLYTKRVTSRTCSLKPRMPEKERRQLQCDQAPRRRWVTAIGEPWLSHIASGTKTHEGRLAKGGWAKLRPGDEVEAFSKLNLRVAMTVTELSFFDDFDKAFEEFGTRLLPEGASTAEEALKLYREVYSPEQVKEAGGVVVVGVAVRSVEAVPATNSEMSECCRPISTAEDLCGVLFRMLRSYEDGLPLQHLRPMIDCWGRTLPDDAFDGAKLGKLFGREPFSRAFFVKAVDGEQHLRLRDVGDFDDFSRKLFAAAQAQA